MAKPATQQALEAKRLDNSYHWRYLIGSATASPYLNGLGFCPRCQRWFRLDSVPRDRRGAPLCPRCRVQLRVRPLRTSATNVWRLYRELHSVEVVDE